jgi:manganese efflux pump family protein
MRGSFRSVASAGMLAALLLAGCSSAATAPPGSSTQPSAQSCYDFGVRALERHVTVTTVPPACAGLSQATVNLALSRAVHEVVGPRPKAAARRLAEREGARLAYLIRTVPPARAARPAAPSAGPGSQLLLSVAALVAWLVTAAAGSYLLAGWLRHGGWRRRRAPGRSGAEDRGQGRAGGMPPAIILGHFSLAVAGLGLWIAFMASDVRALAWTAAGLLLPTAGLGMATLVTALPEPAGPEPAERESAQPESVEPESVQPESLEPESAQPGPAGPLPPDSGRLATRIAATAAPARVRMPVAVIALHGALATATMLLVLLAAIGVS